MDALDVNVEQGVGIQAQVQPVANQARKRDLVRALGRGDAFVQGFIARACGKTLDQGRII